jgi:predicted amidohydrolase YtcJ/predicted amidohydrolase
MRRFALILIACLLCVCAPGSDVADRIYLNGSVWTGVDGRPRAEALATSGSKILAVGTDPDILRLAGSRTQIIHLKGRFVAPGFIDAHLHFMSGALSVDMVDLVGAGGVAEIQRRVAAYAGTHPDAKWIVGRGWAFSDFPDAVPRRGVLDSVVPDRPALMTDRDGHTVLCNSRALAAAGITRSTQDPPGGVIERDSAGEPTGLLKESAMDLVEKFVPRPGAEQKYAALRKAEDLAASFGLSSVQNAGFDLDDLPVYERLLRENGVKTRFYSALMMVKNPSPDHLAHYKRLVSEHQGPLFRFGAVKGFVDGTVDAKTAAMLEPYTTGGRGLLFWSPEELNQAVAIYDREGFQIMLHAIGDRAVRISLDALENAAKLNRTAGRRHRLEHIEVPDPADLPRFKALGVIASTQAIFANPDQTTLENFAVVLGPARAAVADSFKLFDDAGAVQAFGSDWPVFSFDVLRGIYAAVTRMTPEGTPAGGWEPQGRISAEAALRHFTRDAAYASFDESFKGTLEPGKAADFVVLSDDILAPPPERILKARVLLTVMDGRETFRDPSFAGEPSLPAGTARSRSDDTPKQEKSRFVRIGAAQPRSRLIDWHLSGEQALVEVDKSLGELEQIVNRAAAEGCDALALPEDTLGLLHWEMGHKAQLRDVLPEAVGRMLARLGRAAAAHRMYIVCCNDTADPDRTYRNTAFLLGRDGRLIGHYDKVNPTIHESDRKRGTGFPVFETPDLGGVGILICYDMVMPESSRCLALGGADIIFVPTLGGAAMGGDPDSEENDISLAAFRTRAVENFVYLVVAKRGGGSMIISPQGKVLAEGKGPDGIAIADIDPFGGREAGDALNFQADMRARLFRERNPAAYGILVDPNPPALKKLPVTITVGQAVSVGARTLTVGSERFEAAEALLREGKTSEAIRAFEQLSVDFPGTWIDRAARKHLTSLKPE